MEKGFYFDHGSDRFYKANLFFLYTFMCENPFGSLIKT
jgi:hypothetical protein